MAILRRSWALDQIRADPASRFRICGRPHGRDVVAGVERHRDWRLAGRLVLAAAGGTIYALVEEERAGPARRPCRLLGRGRRRLSRRHHAEPGVDVVHERCTLRPPGTLRLAGRHQLARESGCDAQKFREPKRIQAIAFAEPSVRLRSRQQGCAAAGSETRDPADRGKTTARPGSSTSGAKDGSKGASGSRDGRRRRRPLHPLCPPQHAFSYSNGDPAVLVAAVVEPAGCPSGERAADLRDTADDDDEPGLDR